MHASTIRYDDDLRNDILYLAEKQNRKPHWIMVENMKKAVKEEAERLRFIEEGEIEYQKMLADPSYGLTMEEFCKELGIDND